MADAQRTEEETQNQLDNQQVQINRDNPVVTPEHMTPNSDQQNAAMNPTVKLTRTDEGNLIEYIRRHSESGIDCYVTDLSNTCIIVTIESSPSRSQPLVFGSNAES